MKKTLSLILCAVMIICALVVPTTAADVVIPQTAATVSYDLDANAKDAQGILYTLDAAAGTAVVGLNTYADSNSSGYTGNGTVIIPDQVKKDGKAYNVIAVGRNAFDTSAVKEVIISNTVKTIGEMAFAGCEQLERVAMGTGVTEIKGLAFWHCTKLVDASIGMNVTTIGGAAFWSCASLEIVTIPASVTTVMEKAFWNCSSLKVAEVLGEPAIGADVFTGCASGFKTAKASAPYYYAPTVYAAKDAKVNLRVLVEGNGAGLDSAPAGYNGTIAVQEHTVTADTTVKVAGVDVKVVVCNHAKTEEIITLCATCHGAGEKQTVCKTCHAVIKTEPIDQLTHNYEDIVTAPTCIDGGYTTHKCTLCRDKYTDAELEALGHTFVSEITSKSTLTFNGTIKHTCERCKRVENETLPFLGDVNNDGTPCNMKDAIAYCKYLAEWTDMTFVEAIADLNGDEKYTVKDVMRIVKYIADPENTTFGA